MPDGSVPLLFPSFGVDVSVPFSEQPPLTTPIGTNVRFFEPQSGRGKGGSRPGLSRLLPQVPSGSHPMQLLAVVVDPTTDATLDNFDWPGGVEDPSDNGRGRGRMIRVGGSGRQPSKNRKKTPRINWTIAAEMPQGTVLSAFELNAEAVDPSDGIFPLSGSYVYSPPVGTTLVTPGLTTLTVVFTPTDTAHYRTATKKVTTNVIAVASITSITYFGPITVLDAATLVASVNATRTITADSQDYPTGTALQAGLAVLGGSSQVGIDTYAVLADSFGNPIDEANFSHWGTTGYWNSGS